jgi:hypothetical protein
MSMIKYFVLTGQYYSAAKGPMLYMNGFPDALVDPEKDEALKAHCEKNLVDYASGCETTGKFAWNSITYYCSAKTAQAVEKKFKIDEVFTDKDLQKKEEEKADKLRKLMATEEWLENKVLEDSVEKFGSSKQYQFVQKIRDVNPEIAHSRITRVTQKFLKEEYWIAKDSGFITAGPKFPKDKLPKKEEPKEESILRRRKRR